ncbi:MAG: elongation factor Ts [Verrucomicrobiota bacterium]|jgi:elongation factor Ts
MEAKTEISPLLVRQLREKTNAGIMDCKRALAESGGDLEKAEAALRTKGIASAGKKASRATKEGIVASYIHLQGKVGVLVEVNCETDFVAKNENFREFVKDITLHIAAAHPLYVNREEVPAKVIESEKAIYEAQVKGKPENVISKIVEGKLDKFYSTVCLMEQGFIKNPDQTVKELVATKIAELGENIVIRRFTRYLVGEPLSSEVTPPVQEEEQAA